jgi:hypothetical protein
MLATKYYIKLNISRFAYSVFPDFQKIKLFELSGCDVIAYLIYIFLTRARVCVN